ncbi:MAG TPA: hypothetical protein VFM18_12125 [Methanosarcina sp.]|nr:hypothetical protein [Methanosarcina sp.]
MKQQVLNGYKDYFAGQHTCRHEAFTKPWQSWLKGYVKAQADFQSGIKARWEHRKNA